MASGLWGAGLLWRGDALWASTAGRPPDDIEAAAIRVLGLRHLAQGLFQLALPGRLTTALIAVDLLHAASMVPLVLADSPRRQPALVSAGIALSNAAALARTRRGASGGN